MASGKVVRSSVTGVPAKGRDTMGVIFAKPDKKDRIIAVAKNSERGLGADPEEDAGNGDAEVPGEASEAAESAQQPADEVPLNADQMPSVADEAAEAPEDGGNE
jgi:DNA gyrase subunit A